MTIDIVKPPVAYRWVEDSKHFAFSVKCEMGGF